MVRNWSTYVPAATSIVSSDAAASIAAWMLWPGLTVGLPLDLSMSLRVGLDRAVMTHRRVQGLRESGGRYRQKPPLLAIPPCRHAKPW